MNVRRILFLGLVLLAIGVSLGEIGIRKAELTKQGEGAALQAAGEFGPKLHLARLPLSFEANRGQAPGPVEFLAHGSIGL